MKQLAFVAICTPHSLFLWHCHASGHRLLRTQLLHHTPVTLEVVLCYRAGRRGFAVQALWQFVLSDRCVRSSKHAVCGRACACEVRVLWKPQCGLKRKHKPEEPAPCYHASPRYSTPLLANLERSVDGRDRLRVFQHDASLWVYESGWCGQ